jgi:hypothetical protein
MLNNNEANVAEKKFSFESLSMISYLWSCDMFRITLTVFELFAENRFATETPFSGENMFIRKPDPDLLLVVC